MPIMAQLEGSGTTLVRLASNLASPFGLLAMNTPLTEAGEGKLAKFETDGPLVCVKVPVIEPTGNGVVEVTEISRLKVPLDTEGSLASNTPSQF